MCHLYTEFCEYRLSIIFLHNPANKTDKLAPMAEVTVIINDDDDDNNNNNNNKILKKLHTVYLKFYV